MADVGFDEEFSKLYNYIVAGDLPTHTKITKAVEALELSPGSIVLSVGDGTGEPGVRIARALPKVRVISTDSSATMTAMAANAAKDLDNVTAITVSGDDDDLADRCGLAKASVDVVILSYSLMFVPDKAKCLTIARSLLKPGGHLFIAVISRFGLVTAIGTAMTKLLGSTPPTPPLNPLSLADPKLLHTLLSKAGFSKAPCEEEFQHPFPLGPSLEVTRKLCSMLVKEPLMRMTKSGHLDAVRVYEEAFMAAVDGYGYIKDGRCIVSSKDYVVRFLSCEK